MVAAVGFPNADGEATATSRAKPYRSVEMKARRAGQARKNAAAFSMSAVGR
jgi:hypothetical protein